MEFSNSARSTETNREEVTLADQNLRLAKYIVLSMTKFLHAYAFEQTCH